ncbi:dehydrogenase, cytochrome C subunit [Bordetella avium]|nr:dehydrogenase, cytochrome C subunit [Bordetella avium]
MRERTVKKHGLRNTFLGIVAVVIVLGLAVLFGAFRSSSVAPGVDQPLTDAQMQELRPRGQELALAGDCFGCHSKPQGPRAAGGVPIDTPFGTLYSTNITPDPTYGIGKYTRADFHRVLRDGIAPGGRNLYPAMPFVFTHITRPEDIDALYAYMMSLPPIPEPNKANTGVYEFPVRPFMNFWTLLNFPDRQPPSNPERSAQWLRGAYLVEGLGHCAACHTPRNAMMGVDFSRSLEGGQKIDGIDVPNITAENLSKRGFDQALLSKYLRTGISPQGTSFAGMHTVTHFSTSLMARDDVDAIATYLLTGKDGKIAPPPPPPAPLSIASEERLQPGRWAYMSACAGCHGADGKGIPNVAPAMLGNSTVAMSSPDNLLTVALHGIPIQTFPGGQRMYAMPGFAGKLSDDEMAALATWMRAQWGGQAQPVTPQQVKALSATK